MTTNEYFFNDLDKFTTTNEQETIDVLSYSLSNPHYDVPVGTIDAFIKNAYVHPGFTITDETQKTAMEMLKSSPFYGVNPDEAMKQLKENDINTFTGWKHPTDVRCDAPSNALANSTCYSDLTGNSAPTIGLSTVSNIDPSAISITNQNGSINVNLDGTIEIDGDITINESAKLFWDAVKYYAPQNKDTINVSIFLNKMLEWVDTFFHHLLSQSMYVIEYGLLLIVNDSKYFFFDWSYFLYQLFHIGEFAPPCCFFTTVRMVCDRFK